jgi:hypothetical protein
MDGKTLLTCAAAALVAACAAPVQVGPAQQRALAGRFPVGPEVLAFQQYGRQIADRVSTDPHFGGLIFRSEPEPHAIVMFTGNAQARLRRYTADSRFKARRVDFTLAELESMKDRASQELMIPKAQCLSFDADEEHNAVTITGPQKELDMVRVAIAQRRFKAPPKFRLVPGSCVELR